MKNNIAVIGGGSWGTAIVSILSLNNTINWWIRRDDQILSIRETTKNIKYLPNCNLSTKNIMFSSNLNDVLTQSDIIIVATPSEFINNTFKESGKFLMNKIIVSAVKGVIPILNLTPYQYFNKLNSTIKYGVISGPCHAEEVAMNKKSYLTFSFNDNKINSQIASYFKTNFINVKLSKDVIGTEISAILKNVYALMTGICFGLGYGDNFLAVLITASANELQVVLNKLNPQKRNITESAYLGDLLVTCYSLHSRNRRFGAYIGKGYSVSATKVEMKMIAEGYNATNCIFQLLGKREILNQAPIINASYSILYKNKSPKTTISALSNLIG